MTRVVIYRARDCRRFWQRYRMRQDLTGIVAVITSFVFLGWGVTIERGTDTPTGSWGGCWNVWKE